MGLLQRGSDGPSEFSSLLVSGGIEKGVVPRLRIRPLARSSVDMA